MTNEEYPPGPMSQKIFPNRALKDSIASWEGKPESEEDELVDSDLETTSWMFYNVETNNWECKRFSPKSKVIRVGRTNYSFSIPETPTPRAQSQSFPNAPAIERLRRVVERNRNNRNM